MRGVQSWLGILEKEEVLGAHLEQSTVWRVSRDGEIITCPNGRHDREAMGMRASGREKMIGFDFTTSVAGRSVLGYAMR